jgi:hypothetical protein
VVVNGDDRPGGAVDEVGASAGVERMVVVSIIGTDRFSAGCGAAKLEHERLDATV